MRMDPYSDPSETLLNFLFSTVGSLFSPAHHLSIIFISYPDDLKKRQKINSSTVLMNGAQALLFVVSPFDSRVFPSLGRVYLMF